MGLLRAVADNIPLFLTALGVIGGLVFDGLARFSEARSRRVANHIALAAAHREIWTQFLERPDLRNVRNADAGGSERSVTEEEEVFVNLVIQQVNTVFYAMRNGLTMRLDGFKRDVGLFFSLPIPRTVWERGKVFHNDELVAFIDGAMKEVSARHR